MNLFAIVSLKTNKAVDYAGNKMTAKKIRNSLDDKARGDDKESEVRFFKISPGPDHRNYTVGQYVQK